MLRAGVGREIPRVTSTAMPGDSTLTLTQFAGTFHSENAAEITVTATDPGRQRHDVTVSSTTVGPPS
jgi:hypothetical protein